MTREEAIKGLKNVSTMFTGYKPNEEMFEMAIKALETVSCIKEKCAYCPHCENCDVDDETLEIKALEQQPCEDAVSRQAVLDLCDSTDPNYKVIHFKEDVECLPPVTPKKKTGHWVDSKDWKERHFDSMNFRKHCSLCSGMGKIQDKFCPNCGARMVEPQESKVAEQIKGETDGK